MIISKARKVRVADPAAFAWAGLRKFQNADLVTKLLIELHNVPKKYHDDVRKQAQQIRYCLVQAREYFAAANSVTTATKPNLLYYGTMSLALAEILFKQSGASSLDKARDENRHHGLVMSTGAIPKNSDLETSAGMLRAKPHESLGKRRGTFNLWHSSIREHPLCGFTTTYSQDGSSTIAYSVILGAIDNPLPPLPPEGITFAECLASLPLMSEHIEQSSLRTTLIRGKLQSDFHTGPEWNARVDVILHPSPLFSKLMDQIHTNPNAIDRIGLRFGENAGIIQIHNDWINGNVSMPFPAGATVNTAEWRMWTNNPSLNEFGYLYVSLYLAGNYARYFPDKWLFDVEASAPLALSIEEICSMSEWRVPWLALCELDRTLYVVEA
ncbi:MAG: hypothetical protein JWR89_2532 [Tardiphaga sp.]|uniref:YaaC family protein n=1 Tax=Tardiphaga sp. TaxID=1926292 RepID=UPI00263050B9|nr:hypothetical protein [Tardiphaga sp.]MDB5502630.1 hypothetical protein [Tardiphaga sp.]